MAKELTHEQMAKRTPAAPWGRKKDGTARKKPGAKAGSVGAQRGAKKRAKGRK